MYLEVDTVHLLGAISSSRGREGVSTYQENHIAGVEPKLLMLVNHSR